MGGCSNNRSGDGFPQPEERHSRNGVLSTTLRAFIAENFIENMDTGELDVIHTPTYEGLLTAPTLRLKPDDSLQIDLINDFPENPDNQRMGAFPHDRFTTNIHTHGLTVSPDGISDNVLGTWSRARLIRFKSI